MKAFPITIEAMDQSWNLWISQRKCLLRLLWKCHERIWDLYKESLWKKTLQSISTKFNCIFVCSWLNWISNWRSSRYWDNFYWISAHTSNACSSVLHYNCIKIVKTKRNCIDAMCMIESIAIIFSMFCTFTIILCIYVFACHFPGFSFINERTSFPKNNHFYTPFYEGVKRIHVNICILT